MILEEGSINLVMRDKRIRNFEENIPVLRTYFLNNAKNSDSTQYMQEYFGIRAWPDDWDEQHLTMTEIFWEDRNIDIDQDGREVKEKGAKISLRCSVRGYVTVHLNPCSTKNLKCEEDGITLFHKLNPCWLINRAFQYYIWQVFVAYSTVTAIDGNPTVISRCFIGLIRYFCTKNVNGIIVGTRLWHDLRVFLSIVFAVVSSSIFVYFLPSPNEEKIEVLNNMLIEQRRQVDSLVSEIKRTDDVPIKLDSIVFNQKQIEKNAKQKGGKNE